MSAINILMLEQSSLERAQKLLSGIAGGMERAVKGAMTRTVQNLRANSGRVIRERYDISQAALRTEQNVKVSYSMGGGISANVLFHGRKIPLWRYGGAAPRTPTVNRAVTVNAIISGQWHRVHPGIAASGHQLRNTSPTHYENAFVARMRSGHIGIFERTGGSTATGSDEIRELMGGSIPQMLGSHEVEERLSNQASEKFDERLEVEINRILNGWGG